eukprot:657005-Rhodomonas_salina.1
MICEMIWPCIGLTWYGTTACQYRTSYYNTGHLIPRASRQYRTWHIARIGRYRTSVPDMA